MFLEQLTYLRILTGKIKRSCQIHKRARRKFIILACILFVCLFHNFNWSSTRLSFSLNFKVVEAE